MPTQRKALSRKIVDKDRRLERLLRAAVQLLASRQSSRSIKHRRIKPRRVA